jgi:hypothetical protein
MSDEESDDSFNSFVFSTHESPEVILSSLKILEDKLNHVLASSWWQKYISAAFWSNISTPLNLTVMLLTTLTTGQAATNNLLSESTFMSVSVTCLILSVVNTFFRPHEQMNDNLDIMRKWQALGARFERIFYSKYSSYEDFKRRLVDYTRLQKDIHTLQNAPTPTSQNFLTDLIYYLISIVLIKKRRNLWINTDKQVNVDQSIQTEIGIV